ncbi:hypothetical protein BH11PSE11_BH11PSE11_18590 [soil metagenome]
MIEKAEPTVNEMKDERQMILPIHQEELKLGVKVEETGRGVRIIKSVKELPVEIDELLWHEDIEVERIAVDRSLPAGETPAARQEGDTLIVPVLEEVLVVEKRLRLKEEIHITRKKREQRQTQTVLVKSEEVAIERFNEASKAMERQVQKTQ